MHGEGRSIFESHGVAFSATEFVSALLAEAVHLNASDVHIDPERMGTRIQFRVDGLLVCAGTLPASNHAALLARIKIVSNLRTDEHQTAQDGRFDVLLDGQRIHVRVTIMPCYFGERIVLRILYDTGIVYDLSMIGMPEDQQALIRAALTQTHGMILVGGPTGSGKTTTLYALLRAIQRAELSVVTLEDPVEYVLDGVVQIPVQAHRGVSFATGLRSVLRQDPDVIMVGEIRDGETARLAVQAALTGHVVLSSIHTTEASSICVRLLDLGIEPYLLADTMRVVIAQRLVRLFCDACTGPSVGPEAGASSCAACHGSRYKGRCGVFEAARVDVDVRACLRSGASVSEIRSLFRKEGVADLWGRGMDLVRAGRTSEEELRRVLNGIVS